METLDGMVALVTGASSGIGEGTARMVSAQGVKIALSARREDELQRVPDEIGRLGDTAVVAPADLRDETALRAVVRQAEEQQGPVDILIHCGGNFHNGRIHELDMAAWDAGMEANLRAPALLCAAVLPGMRERRRGYVINIASEAGVNVYGGMGPYAIRKHALRILTELIQWRTRILESKPGPSVQASWIPRSVDGRPVRNRRTF